MEVGAFGVGLTNFTANSVADANNITFNGFSGGGGPSSVNFFAQYAGLLAITRSGGGDGNGFIAQLQIPPEMVIFLRLVPNCSPFML